MIDLHLHLLPGIDDGPPDLEASLALAGAVVQAGVEAVVATPHVSWEWQNTAQGIAASLRQLRATLAERAVALEVHAGAEVALTRAYEMPDAELRSLRLAGGPWVLIEAPFAPGVSAVEGMLGQLQARGHRIVLAHVERCPAFLDDAQLLARLVGGGMLASITASSLSGRFGREPQRAARRFLAEGLIHNASSDAHDIHGRPPGMLEQLEAAGLGGQAPWLTQHVPQAIIAGTEIPPAPPWPPPAVRGGLLSRLRR